MKNFKSNFQNASANLNNGDKCLFHVWYAPGAEQNASNPCSPIHIKFQSRLGGRVGYLKIFLKS